MVKKNKNKLLVVITDALNLMKYSLYRLTVCLSLWLLPSLFVSTGATPSIDWKKNMKVGLEFRGGIPYSMVLEEELKKDKEFRAAFDSLKTNLNGQFGVAVGYSFPFYGNALAIGPEVGLFIGTRGKVELSKTNRKFLYQEQKLHIPLALKLTTYDQETGVRESGLILGYELRVLLNPQLRQTSGSSNTTIQSALKDSESIAKSLKKGGSIFLEGRIDVYKGCYLTGRFNFPVTDFLAFEKEKQANEDKKMAIHAVRGLKESFVEIGVGVNIMKWFLSDV